MASAAWGGRWRELSAARRVEPNGSRVESRLTVQDAAIAGLIFAVVAGYLTLLPRNLSGADESVYLYEAKRVLEGEVPYRDVFEITTPGWLYLMAALFRLFGVTLATARFAMAVLHGLSAAALYATCRRLGVRWSFAWLAPLAYLLVCQPAWPIASQHWLGTFLTIGLLLSCAALPGRRASWALLPGIVVGLLIAVLQQRGVFVGSGVAVWLVADRLLLRRYADDADAPALGAQLALLAVGAALVVVPMAAGLIASAGFAPVWQALVIHPLFNYRRFTQATWGQQGALLSAQAAYTFPRLLKYLPLIVAFDLLRLAILLVRRRQCGEARRLMLLVVFCVTSTLSILYFPDYIHIAFIAPPFFVAGAESVERGARAWLADSRAWRVAAPLLAAAVLALAGVRLQQNLVRSRAAFPVSRETAFGHVDWATPFEAHLHDTVRGLMETVPSRELFCYPILSSLYLTVGAHNPTRFQFLLPAYSGPAQMEEVIGVLERRKLPYIVALTGFVAADDPVVAYLRRDYEPMLEAGDVGSVIFRRKAPAPPTPATADDA